MEVCVDEASHLGVVELQEEEEERLLHGGVQLAAQGLFAQGSEVLDTPAGEQRLLLGCA